MKNKITKDEIIQFRTSCAYRWFEDRSENLPITIYRNLENVKLSLKVYLNDTKTHFRKNLSKSEKLEAIQIIKNLVTSYYETN